MQRPRRIAVVSSSRADYGHLIWILRELDAADDVALLPIATAAHLSPRFGHTLDCLLQDGFTPVATIESLLDSDSGVGMAKTIGLGTLGLADALSRVQPDLLLLIADRHEMLAPAAAALALRIPIAHIEGGEVSEGAIDDAVRNALTKLAHLHFVPTEQARRRVLAMGEEAWRVHLTGAPSLDHLRRSALPDREQVWQRVGLDADDVPYVVAVHPVTLAEDPSADAAALLRALQSVDAPIVFCFPNADAGREPIIAAAREFCTSRDNARLHVNLDHLDYWALLQHARMLVGNSSSGLMETPALALPCVDIGMRQRGRERADNVVHAEPEPDAILAAIARADSSGFRASLADMRNPYGDGDAARRICDVLRSVPLGATLLQKRALPLVDGALPAFHHEL